MEFRGLGALDLWLQDVEASYTIYLQRFMMALGQGRGPCAPRFKNHDGLLSGFAGATVPRETNWAPMHL
jgi:hypothetical protein